MNEFLALLGSSALTDPVTGASVLLVLARMN